MTRRLRRGLLSALSIALPLALLPGAMMPAHASTTPTLQLLTEPGAGIGPIDTYLAGARHSLDLVVYELADPRIEEILATAAAHGVRVRILLDRRDEESHNRAAFSYLSAHHVAVRWASDSGIDLTHEKAAIIDGATALVMTLNPVAKDYATTRDFAVVDSERNDVAAIESVFSADWAGTSITPSPGADLLWSPGAETTLVAIIDGAHRNLLVENEEMADPYITAPLEAATRRGVRVEIVMTQSSSWDAAFDALTKDGVEVRTYAESALLYIHAKAIVADPGTNDARAFVGSQNFSITSLIHNRELGIVTDAPGIVTGLSSVISSDFRGAKPWHS